MSSETKKVHVWQPRFPGVVCSDCGVGGDAVAELTLQVECPMCSAAKGAGCVTKPRRGGEPNPSPPHAARQRAAFAAGLMEPCDPDARRERA